MAKTLEFQLKPIVMNTAEVVAETEHKTFLNSIDMRTGEPAKTQHLKSCGFYKQCPHSNKAISAS